MYKTILEEMVQKDRFIGYSHAMEADERTPLRYQIKKEHTKEELQEFIDQHPEVDSMVACDGHYGRDLAKRFCWPFIRI